MLRICCALIDIIFIENELEDVIRFFRDNDRKEGVTAMRIRFTLLRAEQSRASANCALFASCGSRSLETKHNIYMVQRWP